MARTRFPKLSPTAELLAAKRCDVCGAFKRQRVKNDRGGRPRFCWFCPDCKRVNNRQWQRRHHRLRKYGLSPGDLHRMLDEQGAACPICADELSVDTCHVDHDHETGAVRGLLCRRCNPGLGQFRDNPDFLIQAAAYLEKHRSTY